MKLVSNDFVDQELLDSKFTCRGRNISPHLEWSGAPLKAKSYALSCVDPDSPGGDFVHWIIANMPIKTRELEQGKSTLPEAINLENDFGKPGYTGPCPPSGIHRYVFKISALDIEKFDYIDRDNFFEKVREHTLAFAQLAGRYGK